jgi:hypothetical protein
LWIEEKCEAGAEVWLCRANGLRLRKIDADAAIVPAATVGENPMWLAIVVQALEFKLPLDELLAYAIGREVRIAVLG